MNFYALGNLSRCTQQFVRMSAVVCQCQIDGAVGADGG